MNCFGDRGLYGTHRGPAQCWMGHIRVSTDSPSLISAPRQARRQRMARKERLAGNYGRS